MLELASAHATRQGGSWPGMLEANIQRACQVGIVPLGASWAWLGLPFSPSWVYGSQGYQSIIDSETGISYARARRPVMLTKS